MKKNGSPMKQGIQEIVKWIACFAVSFAVLGLCVFLYNQATKPVEGDVFTGKAQGMFCEIVADVTVADGKIVDVKLTGADETPELGGVVLENAPAEILAIQSGNIDGKTGATVTSDAVRAAVTDALVQAGLMIPVETVPETEPVTEAETEAATEAPAETEAAPAGEVFTAKTQGFGGEIVAEVTVADGKIVDVKLTGDSETPGLGGAAIEEMPAQILEAQSAEVDGKTGATVSSTAIRAAVTDALIQAGLVEAPVVEETAPIEWVALADAADGVYSATEKGFGGDITVDLTLEGGKIADVKIVGDSETPGLGAVAVEKMPAQILAAQSVCDVDGISGATVSSTAIRKAAAEALAQAKVDATALQSIASKEAVVKTNEILDVDVVVIGAGGAGMTAAITAKQEGKNVIILEKMPYVGGNTVKASGGMNSAGTKMQAAAIANETDEKKKAALEDSTVENFIADTIEGGHGINDPELVRTMAENSSDAVDWLESIGAPLTKIGATGGTVHYYLHSPADGSAVGEFLVAFYSGKLEEMGIPVYLETTANELVTVDGKVVGVKAEGPEHFYIINAKAVVLATGGFGANEEMYCSYRPDLKGTVTTNAPGATGDGIVMAQAVGADLTDIGEIQLHPTVYQDTGLLVSEKLRSYGAILVNANGQRFTNDLATRDAVSAAELEQPGCYAYICYDSEHAEESMYQKYVKNGITTSGETLEELAANLGFDAAATANFVETVGKWNTTVNTGAEDEFGRNNGLYPMEKAPFYAIKIAPGIHHTMGGIKIDTATHVINTNGEAIPGLFAAGEVTGGVHGGNRIGGNAVADIVVYGRIAGANACTYADGKEAAPAKEAAPVAARDNGVITAEEWQNTYPEIVASYKANGENTYIVDYLEADPYLVNIYEGYGFAKQYGSARGHEYCLEDLSETARPHALANCLTCKTADFTKLVNDLGVEAYSKEFDAVFADMSENVGCYNCHGNEAADNGKLVVTHDYITDKLGENISSIDAAVLSCGQCHIEYYFVPETKATSVPYTNVAEMTPEAILEYYDSIGFSDWTQPSTGTGMLKAQHPEMETYLNGSIHSRMGMSCASCHMEKVTVDGTTYTSHELVSPLSSTAILETCAVCHKDTDMAAKVKDIQDKVTARETVTGNNLSELKDKLAEAVASGEYTEEELDAIRMVYRHAQWFFDFDYVENSEGAHNSALANSCLDQADELIAQGMDMFKAA